MQCKKFLTISMVIIIMVMTATALFGTNAVIDGESRQIPRLTPTPVPPTSVSTNKPIVVSATYAPQYAGKYANDTSLNTVWGSGLDTSFQWLYIDLGKKYELHEIEIQWYDPYYGIEYYLAGSNDAQNWWFIETVTDGDGGRDYFEYYYGTDAYRYVGILCTKANNIAYGIKDIQFRSRLTTIPPTPTMTPYPSSSPSPIPPGVKAAKVLFFEKKYVQNPYLIIDEWKEAGITEAYVKPEFYPMIAKRAREEGIDLYAIFGSFYDDSLDNHPDDYAITSTGEVAKDGWVKFSCPTKTSSTDTFQKAMDYIYRYGLYGISLDFTRYFVFWENATDTTTLQDLPQTCFCENSCLPLFERAAGISIPGYLSTIPEKADWILTNHYDAWTDFKCGVVTSFVEELVTKLKDRKPDLMVNIHAVPWRRSDYNGAIRKIAAQDFWAIGEHVDLIQAMTYTGYCKKDPSWIDLVTHDIQQEAGDRALVRPCIQVGPDMPFNDFLSSIEYAFYDGNHTGVFWPWEDLTAEQMEEIKRIK